jgi:hypothetical protein
MLDREDDPTNPSSDLEDIITLSTADSSNENMLTSQGIFEIFPLFGGILRCRKSSVLCTKRVL